MIQRLFDFSVCAYEFYINYYMLSHFLIKKERRTVATTIPIIAVLTIILYLVNSALKIFWLNSTVTIMLVFAMASILFEGKAYKRGLLSLTGSCISVLSELMTAFAASGILGVGFVAHMEMNSYIPIFTIFSKMIQLVSIHIVILVIGNKPYDEETKESGYLLLCPLLAIVNMYFLIYMDRGKETHKVEHFTISCLGIGWIIVSIMLLKVYNTALERHALSSQLKLIQFESEAEKEYIQRQKINEQTLRRMMHDLKNQLTNVLSINKTDPKEGNQFLLEVINSLQNIPRMETTSDYRNVVINQILNKNRTVCAHFGIHLTIQIEYDNFSFLNFIDTSAIFDNAFDNAIFACNEITGNNLKFINMRAYRQGDMLIIIIRNSKSNELIVGEQGIISSKKDLGNHGFGIPSIFEAVKHYRGVVCIETPPNEFILTITLNINKK